MRRLWWMSPLRDAEPEGGGGGDPALPPAAAPTSGEGGDDGEALRRMQQQIQEQGQELQRLRSVQPQQPPSPQPAQPNKTKADFEKEFFQNPLDMSAAIARQAAAEQGAATMDTMVEMAKKLVRDRDPEVFDRFELEINAKMAIVLPQFRANVNMWQNAFNLTKGEHVDEIIELRTKKGQTPGVVAGGPAPPSSRAPQPPKETPLNEDEQDFIRRFRLTPEQYRHGKKVYDGQGDGKPDSPSSWDEVITFDSSRPPKARKKEVASK